EQTLIQQVLEGHAHAVETLIVLQEPLLPMLAGLPGEHLIRLEQQDQIMQWGNEAATMIAWSDYPSTRPGAEVSGDSSSYIVYTSGSTGTSKGIKGTHGSLSHYVQWHGSIWGMNESSRVAQLASITFDASLKDVLPALLQGSGVYVVPPSVRENVALLSSWLERHAITHLQTVPSIFRLLTSRLEEDGLRLSSLQQIVLAGEKLYGRDIHRWRSHQGQTAHLANQYGLTETTILKTYYRIQDDNKFEAGEVIPVGKAIDESLVAVIHDGGLCRFGEVGEVYIKSPYMSAGYLDDSLT